jgi:hypothetical protein
MKPVKELVAENERLRAELEKLAQRQHAEPPDWQARRARDLGCVAEEWRGWTVRGPELLSPEGWPSGETMHSRCR